MQVSFVLCLLLAEKEQKMCHNQRRGRRRKQIHFLILILILLFARSLSLFFSLFPPPLSKHQLHSRVRKRVNFTCTYSSPVAANPVWILSAIAIVYKASNSLLNFVCVCVFTQSFIEWPIHCKHPCQLVVSRWGLEFWSVLRTEEFIIVLFMLQAVFSFTKTSMYRAARAKGRERQLESISRPTRSSSLDLSTFPHVTFPNCSHKRVTLWICFQTFHSRITTQSYWSQLISPVHRVPRLITRSKEWPSALPLPSAVRPAKHQHLWKSCPRMSHEERMEMGKFFTGTRK